MMDYIDIFTVFLILPSIVNFMLIVLLIQKKHGLQCKLFYGFFQLPSHIMDKQWNDNNRRQHDHNLIENDDKNNQNGNIFVTHPLHNALKQMVKREVSKFGISADLVIEKIEEALKSSESDNTYNNIVRKLNMLPHNEAISLANKIMSFRRKMCKSGDECNRGDNCVFLHSYDIPKKTFFEDENIKRNKYNTEMEYNEVIIQNLPSHIDTEQLREFCSKFGYLRDFKNLRDNKFLVKFKSSDDAKKLMEDPRHVLNNPEIEKKFNKFNRREDDEDIQSLFDQQIAILKHLLKQTENKQLMNRLIWISSKIMSLASQGGNIEKKESKTRDENTPSPNYEDGGANHNYAKNSILCNSKFVDI